MKWNKTKTPIVAAAAIWASFCASMTPARAITINWATVGNPGNAADPLNGNGAVTDTYSIMQYEWTNSQYVAFLNAIDPDGSNPNSVYDTNMGANARGGISLNLGATAGSRYSVKTDMGDKPVNYISWWRAARVANWLQNGGQTYGSTDATASAPQNTGSYTLGTATTGNVPAVNPGTQYRLPTLNQWYKAAYYNPSLNGGAGGYTVYGNGFSTAPTSVSATATGEGSAGPAGNFANYASGAIWNGETGNVTTVGTNGAASFYSAYDMSGNLWEWNDLTGTTGSVRGVRGGDFGTTLVNISSSGGNSTSTPSSAGPSNGFRLAQVPEPATYSLALGGLAWGGYVTWRRRRPREYRATRAA